MTEQEFALSLPQDISDDERKRLLEEWRLQNPQPEVEEEVVEEEVSVHQNLRKINLVFVDC